MCVADDGTACEGNFDCKSEACVGGVCCAQACLSPENCQTTEGATCEDGSTCVYPQAPEGFECRDEDNCTADVCDAEGECQSAPFDVEEVCDTGNPCAVPSCEPEVGCIEVPLEEGLECDDGDPCTTSSQCDGAGVCVGEGLPEKCDDGEQCTQDSCTSKDGEAVCKHEPKEGTCDAPNACATGGTCTDDGECKPTGNACGTGALSCTPGEPIECECDAPEYVVEGGVCAPNNDECAVDNPCVQGATCKDESAADNDAVCTCPNGSVGDGKRGGDGCTPCEGTDYPREINGQCVCDLGGTFAMRVETTESWEAMYPLQAANGITWFSYSLRKHEYDDEGNLTVTDVGCGGDTLDACMTLGLLGGNQAWSAFEGHEIWDEGKIPPDVRDPVPMPEARIGDEFYTPPVATIVGARLRDPLGSWPRDRDSDRFDYIDTDGDGIPGFPVRWRDGGTSDQCPRGSNGGGWEIHYPSAPGLGSYSAFHGATRVLYAVRGDIVDCNTVRGSLEGRTRGSQYEGNARVMDCQIVGGGRCTQVSNGQSILNLVDEENPQTITGSELIMVRVPDDITCPEVRAWDYDSAPKLD